MSEIAFGFPDPRRCGYCGKASPSPSAFWRTCEGCRSIVYCSPECQDKDWELGHKYFCRRGVGSAKGDGDVGVRITGDEMVSCGGALCFKLDAGAVFAGKYALVRDALEREGVFAAGLNEEALTVRHRREARATPAGVAPTGVVVLVKFADGGFAPALEYLWADSCRVVHGLAMRCREMSRTIGRATRKAYAEHLPAESPVDVFVPDAEDLPSILAILRNLYVYDLNGRSVDPQKVMSALLYVATLLTSAPAKAEDHSVAPLSTFTNDAWFAQMFRHLVGYAITALDNDMGVHDYAVARRNVTLAIDALGQANLPASRDFMEKEEAGFDRMTEEEWEKKERKEAASGTPPAGSARIKRSHEEEEEGEEETDSSEYADSSSSQESGYSSSSSASKRRRVEKNEEKK